MVWMLLGLAFAGNRYAGEPSDVVATRAIHAAPTTVTAPLSDMRNLAAIFPAECADDWALSSASGGVGGRGMVTYHFGPLKRRVPITLAVFEPGRVVDFNHEGKKGFVTRVKVDAAGDGSQVTLTSYLNPPPWPFRPVFFNRVRPEWQACWDRALEVLATRAETAEAQQ